MGLLDFAFHPGQKWTAQEIKVLDKNFSSISNYTDFKYDFEAKVVEDDIKSIQGNPESHEVIYEHVLPNQPNMEAFICCQKYRIINKSQLETLKSFYSSDPHDLKANLEIPLIEKFPTNLLQVGHQGLGFFTILEYGKNGVVTDKCQKLIRKNSIKYLKYFNSSKRGIKFD